MLNLLKSAAPLSKEQHGKTYLETGQGYNFARDMSFVPTVVSELPQLISDYTVAFLEREGKIALVALLGLKEGENLYLNADGSWAADYVPALFRQYPFAAMLAGEGDKRKGILCIAENFSGLNSKGKGIALFDESGAASQLVEAAQKMATSLANGALRTETFCANLQKHNLLRPMRASFKSSSGEERRISGILAVDRTALDVISAKALKELQASGDLEFIYLHLASMQNLRKMGTRISATAAKSEKLN